MTQFDPTIPSTTESGAPRESDAHSLSVGADGPLLLHDVALVEKLARFDRERVPERSPHAKGSGAFGELEITEIGRASCREGGWISVGARAEVGEAGCHET